MKAACESFETVGNTHLQKHAQLWNSSFKFEKSWHSIEYIPIEKTESQIILLAGDNMGNHIVYYYMAYELIEPIRGAICKSLI